MLVLCSAEWCLWAQRGVVRKYALGSNRGGDGNSGPLLQRRFGVLGCSPFVSADFTLPSGTTFRETVRSGVTFSVSSKIRPDSLRSSIKVGEFVSVVSTEPAKSVPRSALQFTWSLHV